MCLNLPSLSNISRDRAQIPDQPNQIRDTGPLSRISKTNTTRPTPLIHDRLGELLGPSDQYLRKLKTTISSDQELSGIAPHTLIQASPKITLHEHLGGAVLARTLVKNMDSAAWQKAFAHFKNLYPENTSFSKLETYLINNQFEKESVSHISNPEMFKSACDFIGKLSRIDKSVRSNPTPLASFNDHYGFISRLIDMTDPAIAKDAAHDYAEDAIKEGVIGIELRLNPLMGLKNGVKPYNLLKAISDGINQAITEAKTESNDGTQKFNDLKFGLTCSMVRNIGPTHGIEVAKTAIELRNQGLPVTGIDIAADEEKFPALPFKPAFDMVHEHNRQMIEANTPERRIGITIHAGETKNSGSLSPHASILNAIELGWKPETRCRIGHGIRGNFHDPELVTQLIQKFIGLETCPHSNEDLAHDIATDLSNYPAKTAIDAGIPTSINTDNSSIFGTDATVGIASIRPSIAQLAKITEASLKMFFIFDPKIHSSFYKEGMELFKGSLKLQHINTSNQ